MIVVVAPRGILFEPGKFGLRQQISLQLLTKAKQLAFFVTTSLRYVAPRGIEPLLPG